MSVEDIRAIVMMRSKQLRGLQMILGRNHAWSHRNIACEYRRLEARVACAIKPK
ncbi:unnamed protein product [Mycena citricolor]|uniref:Uncharacterized protein n=1 Tax=Mycena citricolor TaxID=2018698 RepID=A0AAD2HS19_9AGAR|nr:unnamed protein product [Mycena citricolor]